MRSGWLGEALSGPRPGRKIINAHPFHELLLQFLLARQVELVFASVNVGIFGEGSGVDFRFVLIATSECPCKISRSWH